MTAAPELFFKAMSELTSPVWMAIEFADKKRRYVTFADQRGNAVLAVYEASRVVEWHHRTLRLGTSDHC